MKVVWTRLALKDLDSAYGYISDENPSAAVRTIEKIRKAVVSVSRHPEMGRPGRVEGTRELIIPGTPFIVAYRVKAKRIELLSVIHGARRWPDEL
ncbi:MAG: type II toxin-antitoxin system RelE/ParE family toxin [Elusimicrobia bacterium]|nr:type II toxin-antitoxin system RelE/ParE family toxin [Elusimicrobiota bacterium]